MTLRPRRGSLRGALAATALTVGIAAPLLGAAGPGTVPAPAPRASQLPAGELRSPDVLEGIYAGRRADVLRAGRAAAGHGDRARATALRRMADPERQFLAFDGRDGGRSAEVLGDLFRAERVAVLVPGADTSFDAYGRFLAGARALADRLGDRGAVVAWLGYRTPHTTSPQALTDERAEAGAGRLRHFVARLGTMRPGSSVSVLCHSYGTVVCGSAAQGLPARDLVFFASPGTGKADVAGLRTRATVWAGRGSQDWIAHVPHTRLPLPGADLGFGADPVSPAFGARRFDAGSAGHSDYLRPGSRSLESLAGIVLRRGSEASRA